MANEKSLAYNMFLNGLLRVSSFIFPVIAFPYVSRILLPEGVGRVSFATSVLNYFVMFAQMGIPTYGIQACARVRDNKEELSRTVHELFFINMVTTFLSYLLFIVVLLAVPRLDRDKDLFLAMSGMVILKTAGAEWLYQGIEQYSYITTRSLFFKIIAIPCLFIFVRDKSDYIYYGALTVFASYASSIFNFCHARKYIFIKPLGNYQIRRHLNQVVVLFAVTCASMVYTNLDTFMLGMVKDSAEVGYYNAAVNVKMLLVNIVTAGAAALLPRMTYYLEKGQKNRFRDTFRKTIHAMIWGAFPMSVYFMIFAWESINLVSGTEFSKSVVPMQIIMPTVLFIGITNIIGIQILVAMGRGKDTLHSVLMGAGADFLLNIVLIPRYGAAGAAAGTLVAEIIVLVVQFLYIKEMAGNPFLSFHWDKLLFACIVGVIVSFWIKFLHMPSVFALIFSAILFSVGYTGVLLWQKEPLVLEICRRLEVFFHINKNKQDSHSNRNPETRKNMIKKNYYFRSIADDFINHWKIILPFVVICVVALAVSGYKRADKVNNLTKEQQEEVDIYNEQLAAYDQQIEESQNNIDIITEEVAKLQKYIDEAIYMKLDSENIQTATAQYAINDTLNTGNVIASFTNFLAYGNAQEVLEEKYGGTEAGYLRELYSWASNGNILNISVIHYEKDKAKEVLKLIQEALEDYAPEVVKVQGEFTLEPLKNTYYTKVDANITNTQNSKMDTIKNYNLSLADYNSRVASNKSAKADYIENNKPEVMEASAPGNKLVIIYAVFGILIGCVIPVAVFSIRYLLSDKIRSARELSRMDIPVFPCKNKKEENQSGTGLDIMELGLLVEKYHADGFYLNLLSGAGCVKEMSEEIISAFGEKEIPVSSGIMAGNSGDLLEEMIKKKYTVFVVKAGENTYPQLAEQMGTCNKFGIPVWGCIVLE